MAGSQGGIGLVPANNTMVLVQYSIAFPANAMTVCAMHAGSGAQAMSTLLTNQSTFSAYYASASGFERGFRYVAFGR